jgi:phosphoribosylaminoimidazolecarboxamide formyltransferase/IMP cyclohydrolase
MSSTPHISSTPLDRIPIKRALVSVYDKTGLLELGAELHKNGVEIYSTGSTAQTLIDSGVPVIRVEEYTGFPEILGGRVKTLHPKIHAGLLADKNNPEHMEKIASLEINAFDLVVISLYPFEQTVASGADFASCIEQIDIGGPSMLRGSAKNHGSVAVISAQKQYPQITDALNNGGFTLAQRKHLALETYRTTADYDAAISTWLGSQIGDTSWKSLSWKSLDTLRYGENPHQPSTVYLNSGLASAAPGIADAKVLHGKAMSFNNYTDADAALRAAYDHTEPCVAIIKHANPCGIAIANDIDVAYTKAFDCDSVSAFGGVVASNRVVNVAMAEKIIKVFTEVVVAPGYEPKALELLETKKDLRILELNGYEIPKEEIRPISGGLLVQSTDLIDAEGDDPRNWKQVCGEKVSQEVIDQLAFSWRAVRAVKSNAILIAKDFVSVGVGMGQVNRVDSAKLAVDRAGDRVVGAVAASDAFFPFPDGLEILTNAGVVAIVQPGGSIRDEAVIEAATKAGIAMFFTGVRHFSHA